MVIEKLTMGMLRKMTEKLPDSALIMLRDPREGIDFYIASATHVSYPVDGAEALVLIADHPMIDEASIGV
jgi:hypothetical protein